MLWFNENVIHYFEEFINFFNIFNNKIYTSREWFDHFACTNDVSLTTHRRGAWQKQKFIWNWNRMADFVLTNEYNVNEMWLSPKSAALFYYSIPGSFSFGLKPILLAALSGCFSLDRFWWINCLKHVPNMLNKVKIWESVCMQNTSASSWSLVTFISHMWRGNVFHENKISGNSIRVWASMSIQNVSNVPFLPTACRFLWHEGPSCLECWCLPKRVY